MDDYHLKMQTIQELRDAVKLKRANEELLEFFASSLRWLIHYSEKNNIPLPERDKIILAVERCMAIAEGMPTNQKSTTKHNTQGFNGTSNTIDHNRFGGIKRCNFRDNRTFHDIARNEEEK